MSDAPAAGPVPPSIEGSRPSEALYELLCREGALVPARAFEMLDAEPSMGAFYEAIDELRAENLVSKPKDPRCPRRKVIVPHFGPHAQSVEEWMAEVVYGDA